MNGISLFSSPDGTVIVGEDEESRKGIEEVDWRNVVYEKGNGKGGMAPFPFPFFTLLHS